MAGSGKVLIGVIVDENSGDPIISYDPMTRIVTIDGYRFSRDLFSWLTASPLGVSFRIINREDGVITVTEDRG